MAIVTPVPQDPNEHAAKRWHYRQEVMKVRTALAQLLKAMDEGDPELKVVRALLQEIEDLSHQAMEELSPQPKPRISYKKPRHPWDK